MRLRVRGEGPDPSTLACKLQFKACVAVGSKRLGQMFTNWREENAFIFCCRNNYQKFRQHTSPVVICGSTDSDARLQSPKPVASLPHLVEHCRCLVECLHLRLCFAIGIRVLL